MVHRAETKYKGRGDFGAVSLSAGNSGCFSNRYRNGIFLKRLQNRETPGQKFRVYFLRFSGFLGVGLQTCA